MRSLIYLSFTEISSSDLDQLLQEIKAEHSNSGEVILKGYLLECGVNFSQATLCSAVHRVDHANTVSRKSVVIKRRLYTVSHPNALWHIDGNHKMKRHLVKCANNNRAETVLQSFLEGLAKFGIPDWVCSDHGGENINVWRHMPSIHNDPACVLTGSSTHNERVERLWRDVY